MTYMNTDKLGIMLTDLALETSPRMIDIVCHRFSADFWDADDNIKCLLKRAVFPLKAKINIWHVDDLQQSQTLQLLKEYPFCTFHHIKDASLLADTPYGLTNFSLYRHTNGQHILRLEPSHLCNFDAKVSPSSTRFPCNAMAYGQENLDSGPISLAILKLAQIQDHEDDIKSWPPVAQAALKVRNDQLLRYCFKNPTTSCQEICTGILQSWERQMPVKIAAQQHPAVDTGFLHLI